MTEYDGRTPPAWACGASGLFVPAEAAAELAQALALFQDLLAGRRPPAEVRQPRVTQRLVDVAAVAAEVAREHQAAKNRAAAQAASAARSITPAPLVRPAETAAPSGQVTVKQAADRLKLSERRVQQLAEAGRISAVRSDRKVWLLSETSVAAYRERKRRSTAHGEDGNSRAGERATTQP